MANNIVTNIYDIHIEGEWQCLLYNEDSHVYEQICPDFGYYENHFYDEDGNGPWSEEDIIEISKMCEKFNIDNKKICIFKYIP